MEGEYHKHYSRHLGREMEYKTYGRKSGRPMLIFPSQDGRFFDFENFGMIEAIGKWIDSGNVRAICVDSIDGETWSNRTGDNRHRIERHEQWFNYVTEELIPEVRNQEKETFIVTGCSMGAFHAGNFFFRRPDIFDALIALSGLYTAGYGFPMYSDELTYMNSPIDFLREMPEEHPWMRLYRKRQIYICVGQGRWEEELLESTRMLEEVLHHRDIPAMVDYWGFDVDHDWCWWRRQLPYFLDKVLCESTSVTYQSES